MTRDGHLLLDDNGFLADPEGKLGSFRNPYALPFESVSGCRCAEPRGRDSPSPREGIRQGQETDIQVDAVAREPRSGELHRISVIIEVKGCWNRKLMTAMKEQLLDRYLAESGCRYGLYVVGWFLCEAWDSGDYRKGDTPRLPLHQVREHLQEQAADLPGRSLSPQLRPRCGAPVRTKDTISI